MDETNKETLEQQYPSIELAYPLAVASYDAVVKRIDALDGRIQTLMTFALTICLAVPVLGRTQNLKLNSFCFVMGIVLLTFAVLLSGYARMSGGVDVLNPVNLYRNTLHLAPEQFKVDIIHAAAKAYANNKGVLEYRQQLSKYALISFALALTLLVVWAGGL